MAKPAREIAQVSKNLHVWQRYDASVKADLFSTAIALGNAILFVDPVPLEEQTLHEFVGQRHVAGIVVTNANHCRAALEFSKKFNAPIFADKETAVECALSSCQQIKNGDAIAEKVRALAIPGAAPGEIAIYYSEDGGTLIVGDALINFDPYGFTLLPPKYCTNAKEMGRSLPRLLEYDFERILFAHGEPLMHSARKKLEALLAANAP